MLTLERKWQRGKVHFHLSSQHILVLLLKPLRLKNLGRLWLIMTALLLAAISFGCLLTLLVGTLHYLSCSLLSARCLIPLVLEYLPFLKNIFVKQKIFFPIFRPFLFARIRERIWLRKLRASDALLYATLRCCWLEISGQALLAPLRLTFLTSPMFSAISWVRMHGIVNVPKSLPSSII